jgi:predicted glycosyltransferase
MISRMSPASTKRLDVLLYAHDGRGHGHVSRAIAIGLALRRVAPSTRVLLATGASNVAQLESVGDLDWIKLPSRRALVEADQVTEASGPSNFGVAELAAIRGRMLAAIVADLAPRCVLVDHLPLGKDSELIPALHETRNADTLWLLGLRAIVGDVQGLRSDEAAEVMRERYRDFLWYGDPTVHGAATPNTVATIAGRDPVQCGLVSRARELSYRMPALGPKRADRAGTISVPWCGPHTAAAMGELARAIAADPVPSEDWHVYIGPSRTSYDRLDVVQLFERVRSCTTHEFGPDYLISLKRSRIAITYAGYNSIVDTLWAGVPTILLTHSTDEREQEAHTTIMNQAFQGYASLRAHEATADRWTERIATVRGSPGPVVQSDALDGAERAARRILEVIARGPAHVTA